MLSSTACTTAVSNTVANCKYYKDTIASTKSIGDCTECNKKTWLNIEDNATAANIKITCTDLAIDVSTCAAKVDNCEQSFCYKGTTGTFAKGCAKCASGYKGSGVLTNGVGYNLCVNTAIITNCDIADPTDNTKCKVCKSGYAVASANNKTCEAFNTDSNCRKLGSGNWCTECKDGYIFDGQTCVLSSSVMLFSTTVFAIMAFFM